MSTRPANTQKRNQRLRQAYQQRYIDQPRPRNYSKEAVVTQLAEELCLSVVKVVDIIWTKPEETKAGQASSP